MNMGNLMAELEAELLAKTRAVTPEQRAADDAKRLKQWELEKKHTAIETDAERADKDEYPDDDDDEVTA